MDPGLVPGAVSALREDERDLRLDQGRFVLLRDESTIEDKDPSRCCDLGEGSHLGRGIPDRARQGADHRRKAGIHGAEERNVHLGQPDPFGVVAELGRVHRIRGREDEREVIDERARL